MLNEKLSNPLNIMPEEFYHNTLRKDFIEVLAKIKFDPVLVATVEEVMNKADGSSANKKYTQLTEDLNPLAVALFSKNYQKSDEFIRADDEEKALVRKLITDIQDLLTIATCTEEPKEEKKKSIRERLNYDSSKKENVIKDSNENVTQRKRIPNI